MKAVLREEEPKVPAGYPHEQIQRMILELLLSAHLLSLAQETKEGFEERQRMIERAGLSLHPGSGGHQGSK